MKGATPVAEAKIKIAPKIRRITKNGIKNHIFDFQRNPINSEDSVSLEKNCTKSIMSADILFCNNKIFQNEIFKPRGLKGIKCFLWAVYDRLAF